jgi:hypothetical protein
MRFVRIAEAPPFDGTRRGGPDTHPVTDPAKIRKISQEISVLNTYLTNCANAGKAPDADTMALIEVAEAMALAATQLTGAAETLGRVTDRQILAMQQHQQIIAEAVERLTYRGVAPMLLAPRPEPSQTPPSQPPQMGAAPTHVVRPAISECTHQRAEYHLPTDSWRCPDCGTLSINHPASLNRFTGLLNG